MRSMSRPNIVKSQTRTTDSIYNSEVVLALMNALMKKGKKHKAITMLYKTMEQLQNKTSKDPVLVVQRALTNVIPDAVVKAKRVGGSTYQIPVKVTPLLGQSLGIRWLLIAAQKRSGKTMISNLTNEILDASKNTGGAVRKREETQRMADANKVFAR